MRADFKVVIDACVLANFGLCDLLLRLAEPPRLYLPIWSHEILNEVRSVQLEKLSRPWPEHLADSWRSEVEKHFPESIVEGYEPIKAVLTNHEKDRHVLATAIKAQASVIVTFNLKDFPKKALAPWEINAVHPQDYLKTLYSMSPDVVLSKIVEIAGERQKRPEIILAHLGKSIPAFADYVFEALEWELPG